MKYKMRKAACTPFDGQAKLHEECGVFGVYVNKEDIGQISPAHDAYTAPVCFAAQRSGSVRHRGKQQRCHQVS